MPPAEAKLCATRKERTQRGARARVLWHRCSRNLTTPTPNHGRCPDGTYMNQPGASICTVCGVGQTSNTLRTQCVYCQPGQFSPAATVGCRNCSANSIGSTPPGASCTACGVGHYSAEQATECVACTSKPAAAQYVSPGRQCAFECDPGYLQHPQCLSPLQITVRALGGQGWALLGITFLLLLVTLLPVLWQDLRTNGWCGDCGRRRSSSRSEAMPRQHRDDSIGTSGTRFFGRHASGRNGGRSGKPKGLALDAFAAGYAPLADWTASDSGAGAPISATAMHGGTRRLCSVAAVRSSHVPPLSRSWLSRPSQ